MLSTPWLAAEAVELFRREALWFTETVPESALTLESTQKVLQSSQATLSLAQAALESAQAVASTQTMPSTSEPESKSEQSLQEPPQESSAGAQATLAAEKIALTQQQLLAIKQALKASGTSASKQHIIDKCQTLQQLCFAASVQQKGGLFHPTHTTTTGHLLLQLLKRPENRELKQEIFPGNTSASMRGIRHYGRYGQQVLQQHGYLLSCKTPDMI
ncbi:hypothetical protein AVI51_03840 [Piscirickettsia salmonis]|uniref:hypothetical protein n=1 Tax=Piscirickettsia salmonis TaxID=1238 RepID=UPI0006BC7597|nr:hypothetical protein [Piscirickettsia salmonis]ALA25209.1 hypothetical protein KW89_1743 [Piscirickettsia salmonis]APS45472.1 hypothetical protein AVI48_14565 [Piscirickettsia salmonis]APS48833.1 hypothetical protein AVI49_15180 [Piscirickettsia salmonis]APS50067.1 hypothetical protein AVI50_03880 [Piscirickettsia salmonis]APS53266.1 hypothetical protein AVI51_03840 [Piscirickettsia salmonis]